MSPLAPQIPNLLQEFLVDFYSLPALVVLVSFFLSMILLARGGYPLLFLLPLLVAITAAGFLCYSAFYIRLEPGIDTDFAAYARAARALLLISLGGLLSIIALGYTALRKFRMKN